METRRRAAAPQPGERLMVDIGCAAYVWQRHVVEFDAVFENLTVERFLFSESLRTDGTLWWSGPLPGWDVDCKYMYTPALLIIL